MMQNNSLSLRAAISAAWREVAHNPRTALRGLFLPILAVGAALTALSAALMFLLSSALLPVSLLKASGISVEAAREAYPVSALHITALAVVLILTIIAFWYLRRAFIRRVVSASMPQGQTSLPAVLLYYFFAAVLLSAIAAILLPCVLPFVGAIAAVCATRLSGEESHLGALFYIAAVCSAQLYFSFLTALGTLFALPLHRARPRA